jgi:hypothetical protein
MKAVIGFGNTNREIKMKIKSLFVAVLLATGVVVAPANAATENPVVNSFTFTPQEIDLQGADTKVTFELVVSHPSGIDNTTVQVSLKNGQKYAFAAPLSRVTPDASSTTATFRGTITFPRNAMPGVYKVSAASVNNKSSAGYQYGTGDILPKDFRNLLGAESAVLIRNGGELNFEYDTVVGPSYDSQNSNLFTDKAKYSSQSAPIWRVGESIKASDYFELTVPGLQLSISSATPKVCSVSGTELKFIATGSCDFTVFTPATKDYAKFEIKNLQEIQSARIKSVLFISKIADQDVKDLGKSITISEVYSAAEGYILPKSITPAVCVASGFTIKLIAGGICSLTYQTGATPTYLASDLYTQSFEILKDGKSVVVPTPVVTPTPVATPTAKPVVKKTITCVKGKKTIKKTAVSPKCPAGYKLKK